MVTRLLRLADPPRPADAADALALAICHLWRGGGRSRLTELTAAGPGRGQARWAAKARPNPIYPGRQQ